MVAIVIAQNLKLLVSHHCRYCYDLCCHWRCCVIIVVAAVGVVNAIFAVVVVAFVFVSTLDDFWLVCLFVACLVDFCRFVNLFVNRFVCDLCLFVRLCVHWFVCLFVRRWCCLCLLVLVDNVVAYLLRH